MPETAGQEEDKAASAAMGQAWAMEHHPEWLWEPATPEFTEYARELSQAMIYAFDAGMERGLDKRGCLHLDCGECKRDGDGE